MSQGEGPGQRPSGRRRRILTLLAAVAAALILWRLRATEPIESLPDSDDRPLDSDAPPAA